MSRTLFVFTCLAGSLLFAREMQGGQEAPRILGQRIDEGHTVRLRGNTRPEANHANDLGAVAGSARFEHILLQLRRPPDRQQALDIYLKELNDPDSPNFHRWLSASEFERKYGLAQSDIEGIANWLTSHGLTVNGISPNLVLDFSGSAAQLRGAFHTEIHRLSVSGKVHLGNIDDPEIPAALSPAVAGLVSLNDFKPHPLNHVSPQYTTSSGRYAVVPSDLATIYNFKPVFAAGISGQGQTIAVLEDSNMFTTGDWYLFRKVFGLARQFPQGQLVTQHPASSKGEVCTDPGVNGNSLEAAIDAEWASAAAPSAKIVVASCQGTIFTSGVFIALQNLLSSGDTPPDIVSISYGMPEAFLGAGQNAFINSLYEMAVAEGVSVFVASGDSGAGGDDGGANVATHGIAVNGFGSTPYNVAVGGTDFGDAYSGTTGTYWGSVNTPVFGSALSYVPEIAWNGSCASELLASKQGFSITYGADGFCHNGGPQNVIAGGGGPSNCAFGSPAPGSGAGNTCSGYPKPSWQNVAGNPQDGVRDIPDVSLFGSNGIWGHYYVACFSNPAAGGRSCLGEPSTWNGYGGTSLSAPTMAGVQALVNQKTGARWGNPNPIYYSLAAAEYGASGNPSCDASAPGDFCTFHDVTLGDTVIPCVGTNSCFGATTGIDGVLSVSASSYQPAYRATPGWDFSTGLGSVNVANLVANWSGVSPAATATR